MLIVEFPAELLTVQEKLPINISRLEAVRTLTYTALTPSARVRDEEKSVPLVSRVTSSCVQVTVVTGPPDEVQITEASGRVVEVMEDITGAPVKVKGEGGE